MKQKVKKKIEDDKINKSYFFSDAFPRNDYKKRTFFECILTENFKKCVFYKAFFFKNAHILPHWNLLLNDFAFEIIFFQNIVVGRIS